MNLNQKKPSWLLPSAVVLFMIGLLFVAHEIIHSQWGREAADFAVFVAAFGMIFLWLYISGGAIERAELGTDMRSKPLTIIDPAQPGKSVRSFERAEADKPVSGNWN